MVHLTTVSRVLIALSLATLPLVALSLNLNDVAPRQPAASLPSVLITSHRLSGATTVEFRSNGSQTAS